MVHEDPGDTHRATGAWLRATQVTNLALLVSAILAQRTLTLAQLAKAYPLPSPRTPSLHYVRNSGGGGRGLTAER